MGMKEWKDYLPTRLKYSCFGQIRTNDSQESSVLAHHPQEGILYLRHRLPGFGVFSIGANLSVNIMETSPVTTPAVATPFAEITALVDPQNKLVTWHIVVGLKCN